MSLAYESPAGAERSIGAAELLLAAFIGFITMIAASGLVIVLAGGGVTTPPPVSAKVSVLAGVAGTLVAFGVTLWMLRTLNPRCIDWLGLSFAKLRQSGKPMLLWTGVILPVTFLSMWFFSWLYEFMGLKTETEHPLLRMLGTERGLLPLIVVSAVVLAPVFEELIFRGCIQSSMKLMLKRHGLTGAMLAIAVSSVIFALVHGEWWMMPPLFILSVGLGYAYERTGKLWVPIAVHAAFNAVSLIVFMIARN